MMNTSFDPFHLVNTYGAFGSITKDRYEIVIEGAAEETPARWEEYEFKGKPGNLHSIPGLFAPYHLRLDWLMWFAAMPSRYRPIWLVRLVGKLLEGDRQVLRLLRHNPFPDRPPHQIRCRYYRYRFTTRDEFRKTGRCWERDEIGLYLPPVSLKSALIRQN